MSVTYSGTALPLTLRVSEDPWNGDAQFVVLVDGHQVGGVQTATASHAVGEWQDITLDANYQAAASAVSVSFLNDGWGGSAATDRNLYVSALTVGGSTYQGSTAQNNASGSSIGSGTVLYTNGEITFRTLLAPVTSPPSGSVTLEVSEDAWNGDAQFIVSVDGHQVGGVQSTIASHSTGAWQTITVAGDLGANPGTVTVGFLNDAWGGSATTDRNLYVNSLTMNGATYQGSAAHNGAGGFSAGTAAALDTTGTITFDLASPAASAPAASSAAAFAANDYISAGNVLQYDSSQSWSASATVKIDTLPTPYASNLPEGGANLIFGNTNGAPYRGYEMWVDHNGHLRVRIMQNFLEGKYIDVAGTTNVVDGHLLSLGASYDGSSSAGGVKLFINGAVETSHVIKDTLAGSSMSNGPMIVGNQLNGWENQFNLKGQMTAFLLSDQVRTAAYFNPNDAAFDLVDSHTQLAYRFQEGAGLMTKDLSGHANDGVLSNASMWSTLV